FGDLALNTEDVSHLPIVSVCPYMGIALRVNQLHVDPHVFARFLQTAFKNVRNSKLLRDLTEIARLTLIKLCGSARNHFQVRYASQTRQNFFLNPIRKIGVIWIATQ